MVVAVPAAYRLWRRTRDKAFSVLCSPAFAHYGARSVIELPVRLSGERRIAIGDDVFIGADSWLQVIDPTTTGHPAIRIGHGTSIAGHCVLSAVRSLTIGRRVLIARAVYVADHAHAFRDVSRAILDQELETVAPVEICDGAWLGQNVVICPGVRVGRGAVVGANAVVTRDVPDFSVAVGAPARVAYGFATAAGDAGS